MSDRPSRSGFAPGVLAVLAALAAVGCFSSMPDDVAGGGGVETTEGNLASLAAAPAGARVSLIPADFDPLRDRLPDSLTVLADAKGAYRFRGLAAGRYNLEAYLPSAGTRCFRPGVVIAKGDRNIAGTDTLAAPGRLRLTWSGLRRGVLTQKGRRLRMDLTGPEADSGGITLDSLPAGLLPPISFTNAVDSATQVWTDSVRIAPSRLDSVPIREVWAHAALLTLDTTALAPDSLDGYPLLVRLAAPEFPFNEAAAGGADLRFTTMAGDPLPHTVERWDSAGGQAEVWVRLKAGPGAAFGRLRMEWGNPAASGRAGPVFGSLAGPASIWHLDEKTAGAFLADAGPSALRASPVALVPASPGAIGSAQRFDGIGAYASAADTETVRTPARLSVSAWIMGDTAGMTGGVLAGQPKSRWTILSDWRESDSTGFILEYFPVYDEVTLTLGFGGAKITRVVVPPLDTPPYDAWHLLAATYDGTQAMIWLDGKAMDSAVAEPGGLPLPPGGYRIGALASPDPQAAGMDFFRGQIDEARVFRSVLPRAWLDLDYRSQQPGSKLIRFEKQR